MSNKLFVIFMFLLLASACSDRKVSHPDNQNPIDKKSTRYEDIDNFTVLDKKTGLLWEVKSSSNSQILFYWFKAENHCDSLIHGGRNNWYLPSIKELKTLLVEEKSLKNGYINSEYFPYNNPSSYWSSTEGYGHSGWYVDFEAGGDSAYDDSKKKHARCVIKNE